MRWYIKAYEAIDGGVFPLVVWLAHDVDRERLIDRLKQVQYEFGIMPGSLSLMPTLPLARRCSNCENERVS